jgi:outer membrane protein assembly factor BamB
MFLVKEGGINTVFETKAGEPLRAARRLGNTGGYFASPVAGDGKIYLAGENGNVLVLKDNPEYEELALNELGESIIATPAIADGGLYVRTRSKILCFGAPRQ